MPEIRQDPATKEWVILATERLKRPDEFRSSRDARHEPGHAATCPFCPGNEAQTPAEVFAIRADGDSGNGAWRVRAFQNKFAALTPEGEARRQMQDCFFVQMQGAGHHEVIVETPLHNRFLHDMTAGEVEWILRAYRERYTALRQDRRTKLILIFKNHGESAGTSLAHPHSQLVAMPVVPANIRRKYEEAIRYFDATGRCLYLDMLEAERKAGVRIVVETNGFVALEPFAAQSPFETWILPTQFRPAFGQTSDAELAQLAVVLQDVVARLSLLLNDPDYNLVLQSAPVDGEDEEYFLWHIQIIPRLTRIAGFELGSGMRINVVSPEEAARALRDVRP